MKKIKVPEIINHIANDSKSDPTHLLTLSQTSSNLYQSIRLLRHLVKLEIIPDFYDYYGTFYNQFAKVTFIESQSGRKNINHYHKDKISQDKYLISNLLTGIYTETLTKSLLEEVDGIFRVFVMNLFITLKQIPYETLNNNKDYQRFNDFLNNNVYTRLTVDLKSLKQELETLL